MTHAAPWTGIRERPGHLPFTLASGPQRALLAVGAKEAYLDRIDITGGALRLNDARCTAPETTLVRCTYGGLLVPFGRAFGQGVTGDVLHGTVWYRRTLDGPELAKQF